MTRKAVQIIFEGIEAWEQHREAVDKIIREGTGKDFWPSTKSLPPIIFGIELSQEDINKLKELQGVVVKVQEED